MNRAGRVCDAAHHATGTVRSVLWPNVEHYGHVTIASFCWRDLFTLPEWFHSDDEPVRWPPHHEQFMEPSVIREMKRFAYRTVPLVEALFHTNSQGPRQSGNPSSITQSVLASVRISQSVQTGA